jgi:hypothetical protein
MKSIYSHYLTWRGVHGTSFPHINISLFLSQTESKSCPPPPLNYPLLHFILAPMSAFPALPLIPSFLSTLILYLSRQNCIPKPLL